jgi:hypothetical protein
MQNFHDNHHQQHDRQRNDDAATAANFLYTRIQELETTLVSQRMLLEQSRHRESALHKTVDGFSKLVATKQESIAALEQRVKHMESQDVVTQQKLRLLQHESEGLHHQQRIALMNSSNATLASRPLMGTAGSPSPLRASSSIAPSADASLTGLPSPSSYGGSGTHASWGHAQQQAGYGSFEAHDALLREAAVLRRQLESKIHEADATMVALNGLLDLRTPKHHQMHGEAQSNDVSRSALEEVARLVTIAVEQRRKAELEASHGTSVSMPSFIGTMKSSRQPGAADGSSGGQLQLAHTGATAAAPQSASVQMLARENLQLKERLAAIDVSPSRWAS